MKQAKTLNQKQLSLFFKQIGAYLIQSEIGW